MNREWVRNGCCLETAIEYVESGGLGVVLQLDPAFIPYFKPEICVVTVTLKESIII